MKTAFKTVRLLFFVVAIGSIAHLTMAAEQCDQAQVLAATTPVPEQSPHFLALALKQLNAAKPNSDLMVIGDSIADGWSRTAAQSFPGFAFLNFGIGGDRTQNVIWRLAQNSPALSTKPKDIIVILGTNNWSEETTKPCGVVAGLETVIGRVSELWPKAHIFVFHVLPGPSRNREDDRRQINSDLDALYQSNPRVVAVSPNEGELTCTANGVRPNTCANYRADGLHLEDPGYMLLRRYLKEASERKFGTDIAQ